MKTVLQEPGASRGRSRWIPGRPLALARRVRLRDVLVFTVPPMAFALYLFGAATLDFYRISQYDDWWAWRSPHVTTMLGRRLRLARHAPAASALSHRIAAEYESRQAIRLEIDPGAWDAMVSGVPEHWGEWVDAALVDGSVFQQVRIRLRGDSSAHWITPKKSLSIKTRSGELFKGVRRLNLTVKGVLSQYVSHSLAQEMGLMVTATEILPVFINGHFHGLHRLMGRPDELFLRRSGRMPGNIYRGEALLRGDRFKYQPNELFQNPNIWDRTARNDRPGVSGDRSFRSWIAALNGSSFAEHERFMSRLDRDELSRLLALMLMCGDPHHMSGWHNQYWYEDPSSGKMHPIVWDLLIRRLDVPLFDSVVHRFWLSVLRDPRVFDRALELVAEWMEDDRFLALAGRLAREAEERHADALRYERYRAGVVLPIRGDGQVLDCIRSNLELLSRWTGPGEVAFHAGPAGDGTLVLDLVVSGHAGSVLDALVLDVGTAAEVHLWADHDLAGELDPGDRAVAVHSSATAGGVRLTLDAPEPLLTGCTASGPDFLAEPVHYRFFVAAYDEFGASVPIESLRPELGSRFSDRGPRLVPLQTGRAVPSTRTWHPWRYSNRAPLASRHLAGEVHLTEDLVIEEGTTLTIEAGARIRLDPDVSILSRGKVIARGEESRPILLLGMQAPRPWGTLALQGPGASSSRFEYVGFHNGGGAWLEGIEYKGSVSVHNARDVVFDSCSFTANSRSDDLLNAVRAEVDLVSCSFDDANADAIDYDISSGEIVGCLISNSGNDGIDLMACSPRIVSTRIAGSGDKGISIGENSAPWIFDCEITGCLRGLEIKDFSAPVILDSIVTENEIGVLQRAKSSYYAGAGRAVLAGSRIEGNAIDYEGLDGARVTLCATRIGFRRESQGEQRDDGREDTAWLRRWMGVTVDRAGPGQSSPLSAVPPGRVMASGAFPDGFRDPTDGWRRAGAVERLQVRDRDLVASFSAGRGAVGTPVDWSVPDDGSSHVLVIEAAGRNLFMARVDVTRGEEELGGALILAQDPSVARYTVIELRPGKYGWLIVSANADAERGELRLHTWRVLALP